MRKNQSIRPVRVAGEQLGLLPKKVMKNTPALHCRLGNKVAIKRRDAIKRVFVPKENQVFAPIVLNKNSGY